MPNTLDHYKMNAYHMCSNAFFILPLRKLCAKPYSCTVVVVVRMRYTAVDQIPIS